MCLSLCTHNVVSPPCRWIQPTFDQISETFLCKGLEHPWRTGGYWNPSPSGDRGDCRVLGEASGCSVLHHMHMPANEWGLDLLDLHHCPLHGPWEGGGAVVGSLPRTLENGEGAVPQEKESCVQKWGRKGCWLQNIDFKQTILQSHRTKNTP